jgi:cystathionine gamma-synthase
VLAVCVRGGAAEAIAVAARTRVFIRATSLGGVESLIEHRASVEGPDTPTPQNLLRLSIGIENAQDLIADLEQALRG